MVVVAIIGIIVAIATPRVIGLKNRAEETVCIANRKTVERLYSSFLLENYINHSDIIFNQFLLENFEMTCPAGGTFSYEDGKANCNVHYNKNGNEENKEPGEEVPWL